MKKFICIIMALVLSLTLFGCGGNKNETKNETKNGNVPEDAKTEEVATGVTESKSLSGIELGVMGVLGKTYGEIRDMSGAPGKKVTEGKDTFYTFNGSDAKYAFGEDAEASQKVETGEKMEDVKALADTNDISDNAKCIKAVCKVEDIMKLGGENYSVLAVEQYVNVSLKEKSKEGNGFKLVYENNFMEVIFYSASEDSLKGDEKAVVTVK